MKLKYSSITLFFCCLSIAVIVLISFPSKPSRSDSPIIGYSTSNPEASDQQSDTTSEIQRLLVASKAEIPEVARAANLTSIPTQLKIYSHVEAENIKTESLTFKNGSQGYRMNFDLDFPLFSSINYYSKTFEYSAVKNLYQAFGGQGGVLYGSMGSNYSVLTFARIDDNNTHIQIHTYAQ